MKATEDLAIVNGEWMLPFDEATQLLRLLAKAQRLERTWNSTAPYKRTDNAREVTLSMVTMEMLATIELESQSK